MTRRYNKVLTVRIPELLDRVAELRAEEAHMDKATAMRQWLHEGAERYLLGLIEEGRITAARAAEILDLTVHDIHRLARAHGIELGPTEEQLEMARSTAESLSR